MQLRAGNITLTYSRGTLRYICHGGQEILRMIYFTVRDENWGRLPVKIISNSIRKDQDSFYIRANCLQSNGDIQLRWSIEIKGQSNSTLSFQIHGEALSTFKKNRAGFCVLHPIPECAGKEVLITTPSVMHYKAVFPVNINPHQVFQNVAMMQWTTTSGSSAKLCLEGDVFETEDQRNWTDNSYKTYCTPLNLPFPVIVHEKDTINQRITLSVDDKCVSAETTDALIKVDYNILHQQPLPLIGIAKSSKKIVAYRKALVQLSNFGFSHYRVEIKLNNAKWPSILQEAMNESRLLNTPLEIALFIHANCIVEFQQFSDTNFSAAAIKHIILLSSDTKCIDEKILNEYLPALKKCFTGIPIGGGTDIYFAELNRSGLPAEPLDFVSYSINPQVHATDDLTLIENMEAAAYTVESAKQLFKKPVFISPVTFKMRYNGDATGHQQFVSPATDNRQLTLFGAAWTLGSIKYLAESGVASITYFESAGKKGILNVAGNQTTIFPLAYIFTLLLDQEFIYTVRSNSSKPLIMTSLILANNKEQKTILANHSNNVSHITIALGRIHKVETLTMEGFEIINTIPIEDSIVKIKAKQILVITSSLTITQDL